LRLNSFGGYGLALAALALVVFGAIECPPKFRNLIERILSVSPKLNYTPNTLGCYGLRYFFVDSCFGGFQPKWVNIAAFARIARMRLPLRARPTFEQEPSWQVLWRARQRLAEAAKAQPSGSCSQEGQPLRAGPDRAGPSRAGRWTPRSEAAGSCSIFSVHGPAAAPCVLWTCYERSVSMAPARPFKFRPYETFGRCPIPEREIFRKELVCGDHKSSLHLW